MVLIEQASLSALDLNESRIVQLDGAEGTRAAIARTLTRNDERYQAAAPEHGQTNQ